MPEKRIDRLGKLVIRWVKGDTGTPTKNSILGTVIPTIPAAAGDYIRETSISDKALRTDLIRKIRLEIYRDFDNQLPLVGKTGAARNKIVFWMQDKLDRTSQQMEKLESSTLQVILDTPCTRYSLMNHVPMPSYLSELQFRERMHYMVVDEDREGAMYNRVFIDKVRDAFDVDDLSNYPRGSTEYEVVASALHLLHQDWARRSRTKDAPKDKVDTAYMRHLLDFLMENPKKASSIERFLIDRDICLDEVDLTLLDEYVNAPIPTLGDGLL